MLVLPSFGVRESFLNVNIGRGWLICFLGLMVDMPLLLAEDWLWVFVQVCRGAMSRLVFPTCRS